MSVLQGFEEVNVSAPHGKLSMNITKDAVRFNKATVMSLGNPEYIKLLVNEKTSQIAISPCSKESANAIKFCKKSEKNIASVTLKDQIVMSVALKFVTLSDEVAENEISYAALSGTYYEEENVAVFNASGVEPGVMKKRGRKKAEA